MSNPMDLARRPKKPLLVYKRVESMSHDIGAPTRGKEITSYCSNFNDIIGNSTMKLNLPGGKVFLGHSHLYSKGRNYYGVHVLEV